MQGCTLMTAMEHAALRRFVKAAEEFENLFLSVVHFKHGQPHPYLAPTGEPYIEYLNGKYPPDPDERFDSPDDVIKATFSRLSEPYQDARKLVLYWRVEPEIDYSEHFQTWKTYCRFLVSDKPRKD